VAVAAAHTVVYPVWDLVGQTDRTASEDRNASSCRQLRFAVRRFISASKLYSAFTVDIVSVSSRSVGSHGYPVTSQTT